jgi:hypothetical protein
LVCFDQEKSGNPAQDSLIRPLVSGQLGEVEEDVDGGLGVAGKLSVAQVNLGFNVE